MLQICLTVVAVTLIASPWVRAQNAELIERTLAIVGGQVITLSDVRTAMALGLVTAGKPSTVPGVTGELIERLLILREVQRYAPPDPADAAVEEKLAAIRSRLGSTEQYARTLEAGGFTEARLRAWLRDDLRIASYLAQRFAAAGSPSDEDVSTYYSRRRAEFDSQALSFEAAAPVIRERLTTERRAEVIADWIADLRRRTVVVELGK